MTFSLYDTQTRRSREFVPREPGKVGLYVCGATVQGAPHIGHLRTAVVFDQLTRWLGHLGYDVTLVRNVTDIDDKILAKAAEAGRPWFAHAYRYEQEFTAAHDALGVARPTYEPRATGHVTEMIELITRLIDSGHAYPARDDSGDVYFDVASWPDYGRLTNQSLADMQPAEDAGPAGKRDPRDFALWKGHKDGEPVTASWPTPWGRGRPGWHLECSAMATKYLGSRFDIHGGGLDLRFPHHENEQAQSRAAGDGFADFWMHAGLLTVGGDKMSKSLGNSLFAADLLAAGRPIVLRYYLGSAHYRSTLDFSPESLAEAGAAFERIETFVQRASELPDAARRPAAEVPADFAAAMNDDLSVPSALATVHERVRAGNTALDDGRSADAASALADVLGMLRVLGISPLDEPWASSPGSDAATSALDALVGAELEARAEARSAKEFAAADAIRDRLKAAGINIEDTPHGARYTVEGIK